MESIYKIKKQKLSILASFYLVRSNYLQHLEDDFALAFDFAEEVISLAASVLEFLALALFFFLPNIVYLPFPKVQNLVIVL